MKGPRKKVVQLLFKGGSIVFAGLVLELGISFFAKILMARVLGQVEYGVATLGITTLSFSSAVLLLGLNNGVGRYLPRFDDTANRKGVITSALRVSLPISIAIALVLGVLAEPIATTLLRAPEATSVLRAAAVGVPFAVLLKLSIGVVQGMEQTVPKVAIRNVLQPVLRFTLIAGALVLGLGSLGIVWAYTATFVVAGLAGLYYVATRTPVLENVTGNRMHRRLVVFSAPLMLMTTMMMMLSNLDIFFMSYFRSTGEVGTYNVVYPLAELLTMTLSGFSFIFMPAFSRLHANDQTEDMRRIYQVVTKWIFLLSLPGLFIFVLFPEIAIGITFGWEYSEGALALVVLAVGFFTHAVAGPNMNALTSIGRTRIIMADNFVAVLVNVILNFLLIPQYSYLGAAVATATSYALLNVLYSFSLYRQTGIHPFTRHLLRPGAAATVAMITVFGIITVAVPRTVATAIGTIIAFMLVYGIVVLRFGAIQEEEVMLLLSIEERFNVDLSPVKRLAKRLMG
jgi:O-antigen/teichoic acid export membrane protein